MTSITPRLLAKANELRDMPEYFDVVALLREAAALLQALQPAERPTIVDDVLREMAKAAVKFPEWPTRGTDAAAIVGEESGELQQAVLQATYEGGSIEAVRKEAIQTAAMAIQFLLNLPETRFDRGEQSPKRLVAAPPSGSAPERVDKAKLHAIAKDASERAAKNSGTAPQLLYAPILWALQDAFPAAPAPAGDGALRSVICEIAKDARADQQRYRKECDVVAGEIRAGRLYGQSLACGWIAQKLEIALLSAPAAVATTAPSDLAERVILIADRQRTALDGGGWGHAVYCNYQRTDIDFCNCGLAQLQALARQLRATPVPVPSVPPAGGEARTAEGWCVCGHHKQMHPFGMSENLTFNGVCMFRCGCTSFVEAPSPFGPSVPTPEAGARQS